jgi:hypothetical protein
MITRTLCLLAMSLLLISGSAALIRADLAGVVVAGSCAVMATYAASLAMDREPGDPPPRDDR